MTNSEEDLRNWNLASGQYVQWSGGPQNTFYRRFAPFLRRHLGTLDGQQILDLGCGHGWLAAELAASGALVHGVDGSMELVRRARAAYPEIGFDVHDLTSGLPLPLRRYQSIVAHMVLMDLPELDALLADVRASLAPSGGLFVFSILHPSFFFRSTAVDPDTGQRFRRVDGYLEHEQRWITTFGGHRHYHRPLSWYVEHLARHGLVVISLDEPPSLPDHLKPEAEWTEYERWFATIPTMLSVTTRPSP